MLTSTTTQELLKLKFSDEHTPRTLDQYVSVLLEHKYEYDLTWADIRDLVYSAYGVLRDESSYRKKYRSKLTPRCLLPIEDTVEPAADNPLLEIRKERVKLADERSQNNAYIRRLAREDSLKEIALEAANRIALSKNLLNPPSNNTMVKSSGECEGILMLSDWHYGIECENHWNKYNPEITRERLAKLRDETINYCKKHHIKSLHVLNLADLIAGRIHLTIRLESRIDVITQTIEVSEILAEMLACFAQHFHIDYYSCTDNHSRIEPNKNDSLALESLCRITDWYLKSRLKDYNNIVMHDNTFGEDIITFKCKGYSILGVHGDKDKPTQIIDSISRMTQEHFDLICTAHLHHFSCDEKNNTVVICNGAVLGTDTYAKNLRLSSQPSQNLIIVSDKSVCEVIYRILLV